MAPESLPEKGQPPGQALDSEGEKREPRSEVPPGGRCAQCCRPPQGSVKVARPEPTRQAGTWFSGDAFPAHRTVGFKSGKSGA